MGAGENSTVAMLARRQSGYLSRRQLLDQGLSPTAIDSWLRRRDLLRAFTGVYGLGHLPMAPGARAWAALLTAGEGACIGGRSAAHLLGVWDDWREPIELLSPDRVNRPQLLIRRSRTLLARDVWSVRGVRVSSPARTALDLVPSLSDKRRVRLINELRMEQNLTRAQLRDVVNRNRQHPGAAILRALVGDAQPEPTRSMLEDAFLSMLDRSGLPTPRMNVKVAGYRVDAFFPGHGLIVELDGWSTHGWKHAFEADRAAVIDVMAKTGHQTLRLTYDQTTRLWRQTAERLRAILERLAQQQSAATRLLQAEPPDRRSALPQAEIDRDPRPS